METKTRARALVLLSGGIDSTTTLAKAVKQYGAENTIALTLSYGQKHVREIDAAHNVAAHYHLKDHIIKTLDPSLFAGGGSTLIDADKETPHVTYEEIRDTPGMSPTYVPFRNANLLSAATALALVHNCETIHYGAHAEDSRNWAYADCTPK